MNIHSCIFAKWMIRHGYCMDTSSSAGHEKKPGINRNEKQKQFANCMVAVGGEFRYCTASKTRTEIQFLCCVGKLLCKWTSELSWAEGARKGHRVSRLEILRKTCPTKRSFLSFCSSRRGFVPSPRLSWIPLLNPSTVSIKDFFSATSHIKILNTATIRKLQASDYLRTVNCEHCDFHRLIQLVLPIVSICYNCTNLVQYLTNALLSRKFLKQNLRREKKRRFPFFFNFIIGQFSLNNIALLVVNRIRRRILLLSMRYYEVLPYISWLI